MEPSTLSVKGSLVGIAIADCMRGLIDKYKLICGKAELGHTFYQSLLLRGIQLWRSG